MAVDLNRQHHIQGEPQRVLLLEEQTDLSGENLYRELQALAEQPTV